MSKNLPNSASKNIFQSFLHWAGQPFCRIGICNLQNESGKSSRPFVHQIIEIRLFLAAWHHHLPLCELAFCTRVHPARPMAGDLLFAMRTTNAFEVAALIYKPDLQKPLRTNTSSGHQRFQRANRRFGHFVGRFELRLFWNQAEEAIRHSTIVDLVSPER